MNYVNFRVLRHALPNVDSCLIVADGENRGDRTKIDETIQHYEDLFRKEGITEIKEVRLSALQHYGHLGG